MRHHFIRQNPLLDPSLFTLNGWWRASYGGSPWVGSGSLGTSSANNLSEATNPPSVGPGLSLFQTGSVAPASFDGTNDILTGAALSTFITVSAYTVIVLWKVLSSTTLPAYDAGQIISDTTGVLSLGAYTSGPSVYASASHNALSSSSTSPIPLDTWVLTFMSYAPSGTGTGWVVQHYLDGSGLWHHSADSTATNLSSVAGTLRVGASRAAYSRFFNGLIAEVWMLPSAPLQTGVTGFNTVAICDYFNRRHGLRF